MALVRDGDMIEIDVEARLINLDISDAELRQRKSKWVAPSANTERGYVRLYIDHVNQADQGCDLDFLIGGSGAPIPRESH